MTTSLQLFRKATPAKRTPIPVSDLVARALAVRSERTREAYGRDLQRFAEFTKCKDAEEAIMRLCASDTAVAQDVVLAYQGFMLDSGLAPSTINRRISALRSVLKLARGIGATTLTLDLVESLDPEDGTRDTRGPGVGVLRQILTVCDSDTSRRGARDGTIIRWWLGTALRRNELRTMMMGDLRLDPADMPAIAGRDRVQSAAGFVLVKRKRKRKRHPIELSSELVRATLPWLKVRGDYPGAVFESLDHKAEPGTVINPTGLNGILQRRAEEAGFPKGKLPDGRSITPHAIRHTAITQVILKYGTSYAQAFARHANPSMTERYNDQKAMMALDAQAYVFENLL